jgi:hypothetical protein
MLYSKWRLVAKISGGAAPEFMKTGGWLLTLSIKKELNKKGLIILYVIDNIKWQ